MRLLLDSSGAQLVCALADSEGVILETACPTGSAASRDIGATAGQLLGELSPRDIQAIVVGTGPGTFIGTRVAIAYANGLASAGQIPLYGVNSLAAISAVYGMGRCAVIRDARRGDVYYYSPQTELEAVRILAVADLAREMVINGIEAVILEDLASLLPRAQATAQQIADAASAAGAVLGHCPAVPAEGLRRLQANASPAPYVEPVYLRGFL